MAYSKPFEDALNHVMLYEVGPHWNVNHIAVLLGRTDTQANRHAVGYVNDPDDRGGETKFGVSQSAHPEIRVVNLTWNMAKAVYYLSYWIAGSCDKLPIQVALLHFDCCVNHGINRANLLLQEAANVTIDGSVGPVTLSAVRQTDPVKLVTRYCTLRENFYKSIVISRPNQMKYFNGWMRRAAEVRSFVIKPINPSK